jgi:hypothetical protein
MPVNKFSILRTELNGIRVSMTRRITHSASDWFRNQWSSTSSPEKGLMLVEGLNDGAGMTATAITALGLGAVGAGAVIAGPVTAGITGLIGLGYMAKGSYSNRDDAHFKLQSFVWNLVDDVPPKSIYTNDANLKEAAQHATYLMKEASNQYEYMGEKSAKTTRKFKATWKEYEKLVGPLIGASWQQVEKEMRIHRYLTADDSAKNLPNLQKLAFSLNSAKVSADELQKKHCAVGGDIFNFIRRIIKVGNYLQCANIISRATYGQLKCNTQTDQTTTDPFLNWDFAIYSRGSAKEMDDLISLVEKNYIAWNDFITTYKILGPTRP